MAIRSAGVTIRPPNAVNGGLKIGRLRRPDGSTSTLENRSDLVPGLSLPWQVLSTPARSKKPWLRKL